MRRSVKISVDLTADQLQQVRHVVEAGEFRSRSEVIREALRTWLHRRALHAGRHGVARLGRTLETRVEPPEPFERVELMFDAGDAKA
jgi:Arc/MetJ-type ribon-helix-helix transcriptional regulator